MSKLPGNVDSSPCQYLSEPTAIATLWCRGPITYYSTAEDSPPPRRSRGAFPIPNPSTQPAPSVAAPPFLHYTTDFDSIPRPVPPKRPMSDPYFQQLFAERIGGSRYGKGSEIYKFEKIKRAKRKALAEHPERKLLDFGIGENDEMAAESVRRVMAEEIDKPENRGYADNGIAAFKEAAARLMQREFGVRARSGHRDQPLHRHEDGPGDAAGRVHQPRRRDADDRARLSGGRHAHEVLRRRGLPAAAAGGERFSSRPGCHPGRRLPAGKAAGAELSQQPDRHAGHAGVLRAGDRVRPAKPGGGGAGRRPRDADLRRAGR